MKDLIEQLKERSEDRATHDERLIGEAADLLERVYSQPVELLEPEYYGLDENHAWVSVDLSFYKMLKPTHRMAVYPADQLTKAVQEATARALEAAARECDARYMGDNNREDMEARRCAAAIRNLIGRVK